jgi:hypothetical protein
MELSGGAGVLGVIVVVLLAAALVVGGRRLVGRGRRGAPPPGLEVKAAPASLWSTRGRGQRRSDWYQTYMQSPMWAARRQRTLTLAGGICQACGKARATDAHHLSYVRLGFEEDRDLKALCGACHKKAHPERRYR